MKKNDENKLVPKLRFPEFQNEIDWKIEPLNEISCEITEKAKGRKFKLMSITSGVGLVSQIEKFGREIAGNSYGNYLVLNKGDFAYNKSSTKLYPEGEIALLEKEENGAVPNSIFTCFSLNKKKVSPLFAKYPFVNNIHGRWLRKFISVGARANGALQVNSKDLFSIPFYYPSLNEQQKIANCLSSLDELIAAESRKLDMLKEHKKGLLQNLLPVGAEIIPKYRFKVFLDSNEWAEDTLLNLASFRRGSFPQPYGLPEWYDDENGVPFIQVFDVGEDFRLKPTTKNKISELAAKQSVFIPKGTLIITLQGSIGRVAITQYDAYIDRTLLLFEEFHKEIDLTFFAYTIFLLFEIEKLKAPGGIIKTITKEVLSSFVVKLPSIKEQQKIASVLSSLDELISYQNKKVESLKLHKMGLLQGLFPDVNNIYE